MPLFRRRNENENENKLLYETRVKENMRDDWVDVGEQRNNSPVSKGKVLVNYIYAAVEESIYIYLDDH